MNNECKMIHVSSSNVEAVGYDEAQSTLYIKYLNSSLYAYYDVPKHLFEDLLRSSSIGSFLHIYVKNQYAYVRIG